MQRHREGIRSYRVETVLVDPDRSDRTIRVMLHGSQMWAFNLTQAQAFNLARQMGSVICSGGRVLQLNYLEAQKEFHLTELSLKNKEFRFVLDHSAGVDFCAALEEASRDTET